MQTHHQGFLRVATDIDEQAHDRRGQLWSGVGDRPDRAEREQDGRTVYRVRLGPFDSRDEAERQQDRLKGAGMDSALVRVERNKAQP